MSYCLQRHVWQELRKVSSVEGPEIYSVISGQIRTFAGLRTARLVEDIWGVNEAWQDTPLKNVSQNVSFCVISTGGTDWNYDACAARSPVEELRDSPIGRNGLSKRDSTHLDS